MSRFHITRTWNTEHVFKTRLTLSRHLRKYFGPLILLLVLIHTSGTKIANAQPTTNSSTKQTAVTAESIEALLKQVTTSTDLDAAEKQIIEALCKQSLNGLEQITELGKQLNEFKRDSIDVQQRVAKLRQRFVKFQSDQSSPPTNLTLPELEQEISKRELIIEKLKSELAKSEAEPSKRVNRRQEIHKLLLSANQRIVKIQKEIETAVPPDEPVLLRTARRYLLQVRRKLIEVEQPVLQYELAKYDAEDAVGFLRLERDVHMQELKLANSELELLKKNLSKQRAADSTAAVKRARNAVDSAPKALKSFAEQNLALAEVAYALTPPIEKTRHNLEETKTRFEALQKQFKVMQQRVNDIGLTGSIGAQLRRQRVDLPDLRRRRIYVQDRKVLIEDTQQKLFEYDDLRSMSAEAELQRVLSGTSVTNSVEPKGLKTIAQSLVEQRYELLDDMIYHLNTYLDTLFELDTTEQLLIRETERYESYIDERVLWIRSNRPLLSSVAVDPSDTWVFSSSRWAEVNRQLKKDIQSHLMIYGIGFFVFALLLWQKPRLRRELDAISLITSRSTCTQFAPTFRAGYLTLMLAIAWPGIFLFFAWRLNVSANGSQFTHAISQALFVVAYVYFPLELLRRVCRKGGLANSHFEWPTKTIKVIRANLHWAIFFGLLVVFITSSLYYSETEHGADLVERLCFVSGMVILAYLMRCMLRTDSGIFCEYLRTHPDGWFDRLKLIWSWGFVLIPLAIAGLAIWGYYYTAIQLTWRFYATFVFIVAIELIQAFLNRLLLVQRRAISIKQSKERRIVDAASREQTSDTAQNVLNQIGITEELQTDVAVNTKQSQRLIKTGLIAASLVGMWLIWINVLPALRILDQWPVWTTTVNVKTETASGDRGPVPMFSQPVTSTTQPHEVLETVTVANLCLAILIGIITFVCARNIPGLMEMSVLQKLPLDNSVRYAITSLTSYFIVLLGIILAFNAISVGWSKVQWLATALTFGLAFGLQEIFANFVAGLILLFERPIRVGDVVTIDDVTGVVSRIRIRATTIMNLDRKEYMVPNKEFITGRMLNWTLSDTTHRIVINVGVAYGSDVDRAKELLLNTCNNNPVILKDPPTVVTFEGFGDNSLNLVVRTFVPDVYTRFTVIDQLYTAINKEFHEAKIVIAFPQRDLHLRSVDQSILSGFSNNGNNDPKAA